MEIPGPRALSTGKRAPGGWGDSRVGRCSESQPRPQARSSKACSGEPPPPRTLSQPSKSSGAQHRGPAGAGALSVIRHLPGAPLAPAATPSSSPAPGPADSEPGCAQSRGKGHRVPAPAPSPALLAWGPSPALALASHIRGHHRPASVGHHLLRRSGALGAPWRMQLETAVSVLWGMPAQRGLAGLK